MLSLCYVYVFVFRLYVLIMCAWPYVRQHILSDIGVPQGGTRRKIFIFAFVPGCAADNRSSGETKGERGRITGR